MISILAALGIQPHEPLPATGPPPPHKVWDVSKWMPFSSRLTIEKMQCDYWMNEFVRFVVVSSFFPLMQLILMNLTDTFYAYTSILELILSLE
jgi:hypothetical protein